MNRTCDPLPVRFSTKPAAFNLRMTSFQVTRHHSNLTIGYCQTADPAPAVNRIQPCRKRLPCLVNQALDRLLEVGPAGLEPARPHDSQASAGGVRCKNSVMQLGDTRERRRRDDRGAECADRRKSIPLRLVGSAPVAPATALDVAGACCSDRRTHEGSAQGAPGSESATDRSILSGPSARTARQPRWLAARETV
jgi:hypothetical protein